eukprot:CAMPEP_0119411880 /NCGR_PEP_ID=MMETSP1335-20130426/4480_1 /TAXON_ID=259385 /ORGANISM="Chrysoculter rhomboideus, Strain RCC1486" /LENGTH=34 /DNA_ID= /DNA_START= /DNA_END= /DNA_ORIENTATION=
MASRTDWDVGKWQSILGNSGARDNPTPPLDSRRA